MSNVHFQDKFIPFKKQQYEHKYVSEIVKCIVFVLKLSDVTS